MTLGYCGIGLALFIVGVGLSSPLIAKELTDIATDLQVSTAPLVVKLTPEQALTSALNAGHHLPLALAIEGIEGAAPQPVRINVFVNKRDADNLTPTIGSSSLGFIQLLPVNGGVRRVSIAFEIPMIRNLDLGRSIWITLVPVVGTDNSVPRRLALRIARLYIKELY